MNDAILSPQPFAWVVYFDSRLGGARITDKLLVWRKEQATEQVKADLIQKVEPLFLAVQESKPLTHEQRLDMHTAFEPHKCKWNAQSILIDMVEKAHGIKGAA